MSYLLAAPLKPAKGAKEIFCYCNYYNTTEHESSHVLRLGIDKKPRLYSVSVPVSS